MALGDVTFVEGEGGLGRPLPGEDFISALLFYTGSLPSGFSSSSRIKQVFSIGDAEALGILADYSDGTAGTSTYVIGTKGNTGDTINAKFTGINGVVIDTGIYTVASADSTIALQGAAWAAKINAFTYLHGATASFTTATLTITWPKSQGIFPNSGTPVSISLTGAFVGTLTQSVVAGVASKQAVWHYHISEFFRMQPQGQLYLGFFAVGTYDYTEVTTMQNFSDGKIRQIGVFVDSKAYAVGDLTLLSNEIITNCDANHMPISAIYGANIAAVSDLSTLTDLNTLTAKKASVVIAQDGAGLGNFLYIHTGKSVTALGAVLGAEALAAVSDSIAWPAKFNFSNGVELDTPAFANGILVKTLARPLLNLIDNMGYIFILKRVGVAGTAANDDRTAIVSTSDYAHIRDNRTINKAERGVYAKIAPRLSSPLLLNADGTLQNTTIESFKSDASLNLLQMERNGELSASAVAIDATQDVFSSGKFIIAVFLLPVGAAKFIQINIDFTTSIA